MNYNMLSLPVILGAIFLLAGTLMLIFSPKKINYLYGYRTKKSMKNTENWNFAQKLSSKLFLICGIILLLTGIIGDVFSLDVGFLKIIGTSEAVLLTILLFIKTESDLTKFEKIL